MGKIKNERGQQVIIYIMTAQIQNSNFLAI